MSAALVAICSAALLAMVGAGFGVCVARVLWAEDLVYARQIDEIRSRTEGYLRAEIDILKRRLGE